MNKMMQYILITLGTVFIVLGAVGIFLPLLPTTPFLLLGASCYVRASERLYNWLINNRMLGSYIRNYREKKGIPLKSKIIGITMLWMTILFSVVAVLSNLYIRLLLLAIASMVTWHIASQKTLVQEGAELAENREACENHDAYKEGSQGAIYEE